MEGPLSDKSYERFFGFSESPFSLAPNTHFLFESASYGAALAELNYALERRDPVVVVTGEIGTGKTLLCRIVVERREPKTFVSVINDPLLEPADLLKQMLQDFGVISRERTSLTSTSRHELVQALQEFLGSLRVLKAHAVVIIDEAQHVRPDVLEQIRLVANMSDERGTMLQIILVGQTDLVSLLSQPALRQLKQRMSRRIQLESLTASEVAEYVDHRLTVGRNRHTRTQAPVVDALDPIADGSGMTREVTFTPEAISAVSRLAGGIPRMVNLLCDRALEAAYERRVRTIDPPLIHIAARALDLPDAPESLARRGSADPIEEAAAPAFGVRTQTAVPPRARHPIMLAASVAVAAAALWIGGRLLSSPGNGGLLSRSTTLTLPGKETSVAPSTPGPSSEKVGITPAPANLFPSVTVPESTAAASTSTTAEPSREGFEILVASFRTEGRAIAVAGEITALGLPVRRRVTGAWQQVLAGPFMSRTLADEAQERLDRAGLTGTQIVLVTRVE